MGGFDVGAFPSSLGIVVGVTCVGELRWGRS